MAPRPRSPAEQASLIFRLWVGWRLAVGGAATMMMGYMYYELGRKYLGRHTGAS